MFMQGNSSSIFLLDSVDTVDGKKEKLEEK
jgi:hypothetical protein